MGKRLAILGGGERLAILGGGWSNTHVSLPLSPSLSLGPFVANDGVVIGKTLSSPQILGKEIIGK